MLRVTARPRSPVLEALVAALHYHEAAIPPGLERILPTGRVHVMVNLLDDEFRTYRGGDFADVKRTRGAVLVGPRSEATVIDTREQRHLVTVDLKIGGAERLFGPPLKDTRDRLIELDALWGSRGRVVRERLLEERTPEAKLERMEGILLECLRSSDVPDPAIRTAAAALGRGLPVSAVASHLGMLPRTFERRFERQTGLTPKRFSRVRRLQRVVRSADISGTVDWASIAAQHGYADQAHLVHDFRDLTGITPGAYRPQSAEARNHLPVASSAA